jgi:hypothetical protein
MIIKPHASHVTALRCRASLIIGLETPHHSGYRSLVFDPALETELGQRLKREARRGPSLSMQPRAPPEHR